MDSNLLASSSSRGIRSCSDGQKRFKLASQNRSHEVSATHAKKRAPLGHNGPKTKGIIDPMKRADQVTSSNAMLMTRCGNLLDYLIRHKYGWLFKTPVDIEEMDIPDYFTVIKKPMDLGTVKGRITSSQYASPMDFAADVRLTFSNAIDFNYPGDDAHIMATLISKCFEIRWKAIEEKISAANIVPAKSLKPTTRVETEISDQFPPLNQKIRSNDTDVKPEPVVKTMTDDEEHKLSLVSNEPVEEDVDIVGGSDVPALRTEIGLDSTGSESDTAKISEPPSDLKENVGSGVTLDPSKGNHGDSGPEGKASEKDPREPIIERRQPERQQKGKAQLQAEVKAAEEAQIKAAADAAAEATRKRQQERETARQALENMKKTVEFNDWFQLSKDLEMLGIPHDVQVGSNPLEKL